MLRKLQRNRDFWANKGPKYPFHVPNVKIAVVRPENYTACFHISIPTGNRERIWGFKTQADKEEFQKYYARMEKERDITRRLSDALLKVRPLGGSELFIKVGDKYYADPDFCGSEIDRLRKENYELKVQLAMKNKK
jgi:hypothetical protein